MNLSPAPWPDHLSDAGELEELHTTFSEERALGPLRSWRVVDKNEGKLPVVWLLPFNAAALTLGSFSRTGIECPPAIRRSVAKRQAEFLCGRIVAHEAVRRLGVGDWRRPIGIGKSREPLWSPGLLGSISHTKNVAAAVAAPSSRHGALGLDVEEVAWGHGLDALASAAVDETERRLLASHGSRLRFDECITLAFSAKESFFKGAYPSVHRCFGFEAVRVTEIDVEACCLTLAVQTPLGRGYDVGRRCRIHYTRPRAGLLATLYAH